MSEDFKDHPQSIGELRASRDGDARLWSPRDVLIDLLRDIDSGKLKIDAIAIGFREITPEGMVTRYRQAAEHVTVSLGVLELAKAKMFRDAIF